MEDVKSYIAPVPLLGHIGDGNFHLMFLVDPAQPEETELAKAFNQRLIERALRLEGTCTGEHGVGMARSSMRMEPATTCSSSCATSRRCSIPTT